MPDKTIIFVYSSKFIQPENSPVTTRDSLKVFNIMNLRISDLIKHLKVPEENISKMVLPLFNANGFIDSKLRNTKKIEPVTQLFWHFVNEGRKTKESIYNTVDFINIEQILLL